jgi:hypothetical protein
MQEQKRLARSGGYVVHSDAIDTAHVMGDRVTIVIKKFRHVATVLDF